MKKALLLIAILTLVGCDNGGDDADDAIRSITESVSACEDLSGDYNGTYNETDCGGNRSNGNISFFVWSWCSVDIGGFGSNVSGSIYDRENNTFKVRVENTGCGRLNADCVKSGALINCSYTYSQGGSGALSVSR